MPHGGLAASGKPPTLTLPHRYNTRLLTRRQGDSNGRFAQPHRPLAARALALALCATALGVAWLGSRASGSSAYVHVPDEVSAALLAARSMSARAALASGECTARERGVGSAFADDETSADAAPSAHVPAASASAPLMFSAIAPTSLLRASAASTPDPTAAAALPAASVHEPERALLTLDAMPRASAARQLAARADAALAALPAQPSSPHGAPPAAVGSARAPWLPFACALLLGAAVGCGLALAPPLCRLDAALRRRARELDAREACLAARERRIILREIEVDDRAHETILACGHWEEHARVCAEERHAALAQLELVREHARALQVRARTQCARRALRRSAIADRRPAHRERVRGLAHRTVSPTRARRSSSRPRRTMSTRRSSSETRRALARRTMRVRSSRATRPLPPQPRATRRQ